MTSINDVQLDKTSGTSEYSKEENIASAEIGRLIKINNLLLVSRRGAMSLTDYGRVRCPV